MDFFQIKNVLLNVTGPVLQLAGISIQVDDVLLQLIQAVRMIYYLVCYGVRQLT